MPRATRCVYGPVPSRRLGLSLGVDLVPFKVCCYDCVYCQLGPTTRLTTERRTFIDPDRVVRQVEQALSRGPLPQVITLAGSGEPTLHQDLDQLVQGLRRITDLPLALLTNGALLSDDRVKRVALDFDLVAPSLDAADPETFSLINRPADDVRFEQVIEGLSDFCRRFQGSCRLEIMLVRGINDSERSVEDLARLVGPLDVETVDLNTVVRPPAFEGVSGLSEEAMSRARSKLGPRARIIVPFDADRASTGSNAAEGLRQRILDLVARRPCTTADLCLALGVEEQRVRTACRAAVAGGLLRRYRQEGASYYVRA